MKKQSDKNHAEQELWLYLRDGNFGYTFRRQVPLAGTKYVADFYCEQLKFDIEVDGGVHNQEWVKAKDIRRDEKLRSLGISVLRIAAEGVKASRIKRTLHQIRDAMECRIEELRENL